MFNSFIKSCKIAAIIMSGLLLVAGGITLGLFLIFAPFYAAQQLALAGYCTWQPFVAILGIFFLYLYAATLGGLFKDLHI